MARFEVEVRPFEAGHFCWPGACDQREQDGQSVQVIPAVSQDPLKNFGANWSDWFRVLGKTCSVRGRVEPDVRVTVHKPVPELPDSNDLSVDRMGRDVIAFAEDFVILDVHSVEILDALLVPELLEEVPQGDDFSLRRRRRGG